MVEKGIRRAPGDGPSGCAAFALGPDPAFLEQHVQRPLAEADATDFFDLATGYRLVVGNDGQCFDGGAGQLAGYFAFTDKLAGQIGGRAEAPGLPGLHQVDAAPFVVIP